MVKKYFVLIKRDSKGSPVLGIAYPEPIFVEPRSIPKNNSEKFTLIIDIGNVRSVVWSWFWFDDEVGFPYLYEAERELLKQLFELGN